MRMNEEMEKLGKEIIGSYDVRVGRVGQLKKETEETLKNFQDVHKKMSFDQREYLSKYKENLEGEVKETLKGFRLSLEKMGGDLRKDLTKGVERRKAEVSKTLDDFKVSHNQMSKELKKNLSRDNQEMKSEVKKMLNDFQTIQDKLRADLQKVSLSWQQTASIMQEKRSGVKPLPKIAEKKIVKKELPKPEQNIIKENLSDKQETLALIKKRPEGIKLSEIGAELGKDWRWYIAIVKELMEESKIRKEDNLYYPMI